MNFNFNMPTRLITGAGCLEANAGELAKLGNACLIVTGKSSARRSGALADTEAALKAQGIAWKVFDEAEPNPLLETSWRAGDIAREMGAAFVIGIGGGSALDAAKAAAVFASNPMPMMQIYDGPWANPALPVIAVGTTAGTGSEVAPYAVLTPPDGHKRSFNGQDIYPVIAFGDPKYTASLPWNFTVSTALDALAHALEGYFNIKANNMSDIFAVQAVKMLFGALGRLEKIPENAEIPTDLREELYYASVVAGVTLSQCGTCYCHRLSYQLTEAHGVPHGTACAVFIPGYLRREQRLLPERMDALLSAAGCGLDELSELVGRLTHLDPIKMSAEEIRDVVTRNEGCGNFVNTAPGGFSSQEVEDVLAGLFG